MQSVGTAVGAEVVRRQFDITCIRIVKCRSDSEESDHVLNKLDVVECAQGSGDCHLQPLGYEPADKDGFQPSRPDHGTLRWMAKDQKQGRGFECRNV